MRVGPRLPVDRRQGALPLSPSCFCVFERFADAVLLLARPQEKIEEQPPHPLDLEVQLVALRRRERPASVPSSPVEGAQHKLSLGATSVDVMKRVDEVKEGGSAAAATVA